MTREPNLPDGFLTILDARTRIGQVLYGTRWPAIEKASNVQVELGRHTMFSAGTCAEEETIRSIGDGVIEAASKSWKYRARVITELLDRLRSGALRGYIFRHGGMPEIQPSDAWQDQALVDALSSGCIEEGGQGRQKKIACLIVRDDDLQSTLIAVEPPKQEAANQSSISQLETAKLRTRLKAWLEHATREKERQSTRKPGFRMMALQEVDERISKNLFLEVWRDADIPARFRKRGRPPSK